MAFFWGVQRGWLSVGLRAYIVQKPERQPALLSHNLYRSEKCQTTLAYEEMPSKSTTTEASPKAQCSWSSFDPLFDPGLADLSIQTEPDRPLFYKLSRVQAVRQSFKQPTGASAAPERLSPAVSNAAGPQNWPQNGPPKSSVRYN